MKHIFLHTLLLLLLALQANAQTSIATISGKFTDAKTEEPLPGASVYMEEMGQGVLTDLPGTRDGRIIV